MGVLFRALVAASCAAVSLSVPIDPTPGAEDAPVDAAPLRGDDGASAQGTTASWEAPGSYTDVAVQRHAVKVDAPIGQQGVLFERHVGPLISRLANLDLDTDSVTEIYLDLQPADSGQHIGGAEGWSTSQYNPDSPPQYRRMQSGAGVATLTIDYHIRCGASCADINARLTHIATDPVAGAEHAQRITDAINAAAAAAGFGEAVVLSSAEEIVASISIPENVVISLPPPPPAIATDCDGEWEPCTEACESAELRVWTQSVAPEGEGAGCPNALPCLPGDGACPMCEPVFLGADIGYANIMSFHDADQDCRISMAELAAVCRDHFAECISFLESSEPPPEPEPEPEPEPAAGGCEPVFLGPDMGFVNIMQFHDEDGTCTLSMAELATLCSDHFDECLSFLNSAPDALGDGGAEGTVG